MINVIARFLSSRGYIAVGCLRIFCNLLPWLAVGYLLAISGFFDILAQSGWYFAATIDTEFLLDIIALQVAIIAFLIPLLAKAARDGMSQYKSEIVIEIISRKLGFGSLLRWLFASIVLAIFLKFLACAECTVDNLSLQIVSWAMLSVLLINSAKAYGTLRVLALIYPFSNSNRLVNQLVRQLGN